MDPVRVRVAVECPLCLEFGDVYLRRLPTGEAVAMCAECGVGFREPGFVALSRSESWEWERTGHVDLDAARDSVWASLVKP